MTILKNKRDISKIKDGGNVIRDIFVYLEEIIKPGISTAYLDKMVEDVIRSNDAEPAFKGYKGYPASICTSVNQVVVHGIPSEDIILSEGDIVGIDIGVKKNGFFTDAARTFAVGNISEEAKNLLKVTKDSLKEGIEEAIAGNRVSDISSRVQSVINDAGFKEVRTFVGHGVGRYLHESPEVPNWGEPGKGPILEEGLVLAVEPMANAGTREVEIMPDGWTAVTRDGKLSAHFEHTIIVGKEKAEIIT